MAPSNTIIPVGGSGAALARGTLRKNNNVDKPAIVSKPLPPAPSTAHIRHGITRGDVSVGAAVAGRTALDNQVKRKPVPSVGVQQKIQTQIEADAHALATTGEIHPYNSDEEEQSKYRIVGNVESKVKISKPATAPIASSARLSYSKQALSTKPESSKQPLVFRDPPPQRRKQSSVASSTKSVISRAASSVKSGAKKSWRKFSDAVSDISVSRTNFEEPLSPKEDYLEWLSDPVAQQAIKSQYMAHLIKTCPDYTEEQCAKDAEYFAKVYGTRFSNQDPTRPIKLTSDDKHMTTLGEMINAAESKRINTESPASTAVDRYTAAAAAAAYSTRVKTPETGPSSSKNSPASSFRTLFSSSSRDTSKADRVDDNDMDFKCAGERAAGNEARKLNAIWQCTSCFRWVDDRIETLCLECFDNQFQMEAKRARDIRKAMKEEKSPLKPKVGEPFIDPIHSLADPASPLAVKGADEHRLPLRSSSVYSYRPPYDANNAPPMPNQCTLDRSDTSFPAKPSPPLEYTIRSSQYVTTRDRFPSISNHTAGHSKTDPPRRTVDYAYWDDLLPTTPK